MNYNCIVGQRAVTRARDVNSTRIHAESRVGSWCLTSNQQSSRACKQVSCGEKEQGFTRKESEQINLHKHDWVNKWRRCPKRFILCSLSHCQCLVPQSELCPVCFPRIVLFMEHLLWKKRLSGSRHAERNDLSVEYYVWEGWISCIARVSLGPTFKYIVAVKLLVCSRTFK